MKLLLGYNMNIVISGRWGELTFGGGNKKFGGRGVYLGRGGFFQVRGDECGTPLPYLPAGKTLLCPYHAHSMIDILPNLSECTMVAFQTTFVISHSARNEYN